MEIKSVNLTIYEILGKEDTKVITCHIGNGASMLIFCGIISKIPFFEICYYYRRTLK